MAAPERFIALEEHCITPDLDRALLADTTPADRKRWTAVAAQTHDIGERRLRDMDALGVDLQILSQRPPGAQLPEPELAVAEARRANDQMAAAIARHPTRFAGFATLPIADPEAAARELRRCVEDLGFVGAMIHGRVNGQFLDQPANDPVLGALADLDVPLFLHPGEPTAAVWREYYTDLQVPAEANDMAEILMAGSAWGWHAETGLHALRMILGGVFDRYPSLQVVLGHWGEMLPFFIHRFETVSGVVTGHLQRSPVECFNENFYVTPSGLETIPPLLMSLSVVGADRIMYAIDYPFSPHTIGRAFIDHAPISDADKAKIAHRNAERLFRL